MTDLASLADGLSRTVKLAIDTGEARTVEEAQRIFANYRVQVLLGDDVAGNPVLEAIALTAVNCATRCMLGGVNVVGGDGDLAVRLPGMARLRDSLVALGAAPSPVIDPQRPAILVGAVDADGLEAVSVRASFDHWAGAALSAKSNRLSERGAFTPAGVLAGALAVSEIFQHVRPGNGMAGRRGQGFNLWRPEQDWRKGEAGPALERLPAAAWLVGVGNLGQAYLWTLGLLPYRDLDLELVLQDIDVLAPSNLSTSLLTRPAMLGMRKTRAMAAWAETRGFCAHIVERPFSGNFRIGDREPAVGLIGVDNALARQAAEDVGFARVIEAGLGKGPQDYLGMALHSFPASRQAREIWHETGSTDQDLTLPVYRALLEATGDRCGTLRLASRSIGAPFVGAVAASLAIAELVRMAMGEHRYEVISAHLRDTDMRTVVAGEPWAPFNPGTVGSRSFESEDALVSQMA